ncbi:hypothetical protein GCM10007207_02770 [Asaia siamensis]|uniref:Uncharacterized protein n=1 Tax=Asaia siamensis TaxID=110479 RepID=A0ABQ1LD63_9PROT|nr:hypothetical protein AA0323_2352 [Asaia siamensis NRIC 0323]GGC21005.1 hypothetical protein GCM10007207_02770 [Asaia siamensis]
MLGKALGNVIELGLIEIKQHYMAAFLCKASGNGQADIPCGTSHKGGLACEAFRITH